MRAATYPENIDLRRTRIKESLMDMLILSRGYKEEDAFGKYTVVRVNKQFLSSNKEGRICR